MRLDKIHDTDAQAFRDLRLPLHGMPAPIILDVRHDGDFSIF